jgi:multidrug transporter EmrE-like cation transporter
MAWVYLLVAGLLEVVWAFSIPIVLRWLGVA